MNLQNFISKVKNVGFIRQPGFDVQIIPPKSTLATTTYSYPDISLKAFSVNTPSYQFTSAEDYVEVTEYRKYAYDYSRGVVVISFLIDADYEVVKIFDEWKDSIFNKRSRAVSYYDSYVTDMTIYIKKHSDEVSAKYVFKEVYPKAINEINFDWGQSNTAVLNVTFEYAKYYLLDANESVSDSERGDINEANSKSDLNVDEISADPQFNTTDAASFVDDSGEEGSEESAKVIVDGSGEAAIASAVKLESELEIAPLDSEIDTDPVILESTGDSLSSFADNTDDVGISMREDVAKDSIGDPENMEAVMELAEMTESASADAKEASEEIKAAAAMAKEEQPLKEQIREKIDKAESKLANGLAKISAAAEKFENRKKEFETFAKKVVNGLDEVNKLANVLDTAKGIKSSFDNFKRLTKQIRAKNKFGAISAAKAATRSISTTLKGVSKLGTNVKRLGKVFGF